MRNQILLILLLLSQSIFAQTKIFGELKQNSGTPLFLMENIGGVYSKIDSCIIQLNGKYSFGKNLKTGYYALGLSDSNFVQIIIQPSEEIIEIDFLSSNLKQSILIKQSEENKLLWDFMRYRRGIKQKISQTYIEKSYLNEKSYEYYLLNKQEDSLKQEYNHHVLDLYEKHKDTFFAETIASEIELTNNEDFFKYTFFNNPNLIRSGVITRKVGEYLQFRTEYTEDGFITAIDLILLKASENKEVYDFVLNYLLELFNQVGPDVILDYLVEEYVNSDGCSDLETSEILAAKLNAYKKLSIGKTAPSISMFDSENTLHNLRDLYSFSRINILFFGSSMCHFCQDVKPQLENYSEGKNITDLQVIYITLDTNYQVWQKEAQSIPKNWISLSELKGWDSQSTEVFQIHKTPSFYIIDSKAQIISKPKNIEDLIEELGLLGI
jgi:thioredoxin-related protein